MTPWGFCAGRRVDGVWEGSTIAARRVDGVREGSTIAARHVNGVKLAQDAIAAS